MFVNRRAFPGYMRDVLGILAAVRALALGEANLLELAFGPSRTSRDIVKHPSFLFPQGGEDFFMDLGVYLFKAC